MKKISIGLNVVLLLVIVYLLVEHTRIREAAIAGRPDKAEAITDESVVPPWQPYLDDSVYTVPDFPLVDMPVRYHQGEVVLVISNNWGGPPEETQYLFTDDRQILDEIQNRFYVLTFPPDRGTTPDSMVYVYQDGVLIKEIPFAGESDIDRHYSFAHLSKAEVEDRIGQKLP